jgi:nicastrin
MGYKYPQYVAKLNTEMWAEEYPNSFDCLSHRKCLPVGGYSVVSTLPSSEAAGAKVPEECVLVLASLGNSNIFHNWDEGAEASISGVIAGLAAYEAVSLSIARATAAGGSKGRVVKRRLAFGFMNSEGYGLAGSRRMAFDLRNQTRAISGCYLKDISYIVEIGSVGLATTRAKTRSVAAAGSQQQAEYFLHMTPDSKRSNASVFDVFQAAAKDVAKQEVSVAMPSESNPGIPPSSLMSFQNIETTSSSSSSSTLRSIPGAVLTDFNEQIANQYLSSFFDDGENVDTDSVYAAAELISRALHTIAFDNNDDGDDDSFLDKELLNSTVYGLSECLLTPKPGMQCPLVQQVADTSAGSVNLYPGVRFWPLANDQDPNDKSDLSRFIWSFLATRSEGAKLGPHFDERMNQSPACDFPGGKLKCQDKNQLCARWRPKEGKDKDKTNHNHNGRCVNATIQYVPGWSGLLSFSVKSNKWSINGTKDTVMDEIWTESFWSNSVPSASVYLTEGYTYELVLFVVGLGLTVAWFFGMKKIKLYTEKELKQF